MVFLVSLLFLLICSLLPGNAFAHIDGVSIFTINGSNTKVYKDKSAFDGSATPSDSDSAPEEYPTNEELNFAIDLSKFPTSDQIFQKTTLIWDFGDGTPPDSRIYGKSNSHTYTKPGTYKLTVTADYKTSGFSSIPPQILQVVYLTVTDESKPTTGNIFIPVIAGTVFTGILLFILLKKKRTKKKK